jgi:hypothetical protein
MLDGSDIISFHDYSRPDDMRERVQDLRRYGRPISRALVVAVAPAPGAGVVAI